MGSAVTIFGLSILGLLLAGYFGQKYMPPPKAKVIGIDLGTTFSCLGIYEAGTGEVRVVGDLNNHSCIPSVVAYMPEGVLVGHEAVAQAEQNPANTVYDAKRFIGKVFTSEEFAEETVRYPFKLSLDDRGMVNFVVGSADNQTLVRPEEVGGAILRALKAAGEAQLSKTINAAVMSVPAEFGEMQRNYTCRAAGLAGISVWRVISEPTAAALACGLHRQGGEGTVMVVDLGGGTLDVSLLLRQGGMFLTHAMAGNNHLGGQDLNNRLFNYLRQCIEKDWGVALDSRVDLQSLRLLTERLKIALTDSPEVPLNFTSHSLTGADGAHRAFLSTITRRKFEELTEDLLQKVLDPIKAVLNYVERTPEEIDHVVLVGGSTRVPRVRWLVQQFFGKPPLTNVDPDQAVAIGTGIQAGILGDMWPVTVSATEVPTSVSKIKVR